VVRKECFTAMYNINRDGDYLMITECDPQSLPTLTGETADSGGRVVYRAKKTDFIIINGHAEEVAKIPDKELIQALHDKGLLI
jgi:hypothetical protein